MTLYMHFICAFLTFVNAISADYQPLHIKLANGRYKRAIDYVGGCLNPPLAPYYSKLRCTAYGCRATCDVNYAFPNGETKLQINCKEGKWFVEDDKYTTIPDCKISKCDPPCLNGGTCVEPGKCKCADSFAGKQCEIEIKACVTPPDTLEQTCLCTSTHCIFTCKEEYEFPDGTSKLETICVSGNWLLLNGQQPPTCQAICKPPCQNKGKCLRPNVCECLPQFKGSHCEYDPDVICNEETFSKFNVLHKCSVGEESKECTLSCPEGTKSNVPFASVYDCIYSEKKFVLENIPTCEELKPAPGSCFTWSGVHFKTFDGKIFSFTSPCGYVLVEDALDNTFSIVLRNDPLCNGNNQDACSRHIKIHYQEKDYILKQSAQGIPIIVCGDKVLAVPGELPGIKIETTGQYTVVKLDPIGVTLKWDGINFVQVEVQENLWGKTGGLCGKLDGILGNDMVIKCGENTKNIFTFVTSWESDSFDAECKSKPVVDNSCVDKPLQDEANAFCEKMLSDKRFASCNKVMNIQSLFDACVWSYCTSTTKESVCDTLNMYVRECIFQGVTDLKQWRDDKTCPMKCTGGRIYKVCGPAKGEAVCNGATKRVNNVACEEGCYCPEGTVLHNSQCIAPSNCPCEFHGKEMEVGSVLPKDCNTCTCKEGMWNCTEEDCHVRCLSVGDPHYTTFDGKQYDFMGDCVYYLVKHVNFSIAAENVACTGTIEEMQMIVGSGMPSCTKAAIIDIAGHVIKLKLNFEVIIDDKDVSSELPISIAGVVIRFASSAFLLAELPNAVKVWWDGQTRLFVDAPPSLTNQTEGLCGTLNDNQKDDFLTPDGHIDQNEISFANKWIVNDSCPHVPEEDIQEHPCTKNPKKKPQAQKNCKVMKSDVFSECHFDVDPEHHYQNCLYDVCSCEFQIPRCLCPIITSYAAECARKGINIDWRDEVKGCGIHCPGGQKYQACGNSCTRTCQQISAEPNCKFECVEGCNCPPGETLNEQETCIPVAQCHCIIDDVKYPPGYKEIRSLDKAMLCECVNATWSCTPATPEDVTKYPDGDEKSKCKPEENKEFTLCKRVEQVTCKTMHINIPPSVECHPGCQCKTGYVMDTISQTCMKPTQCACYHGGRSYAEDSVVKYDCNSCTCKHGKFTCTENKCPGECSVFGGSHFNTFDGKMYNYEGQCDYVLAKGQKSDQSSFHIIIQNVPCGSVGVSCSKSVTIKAEILLDKESITLTQGVPIPDSSNFKHLLVRQISQYVFVEIPELGVTVKWDKGTRVYVRMGTSWIDKVRGLCGNYNDNVMDDFQTPGGNTETSPQLFGDSWRLQPYCSEAEEIKDTCEKRPGRKSWAIKQCGILKSSVFASCHSKVPVEPFINNCIFDGCACDQGGDCKCLCTALAAYAHECNRNGIYIKWRTPDLCPMQCDSTCSSYDPCVSTCPTETCENKSIHQKLSPSCENEVCVEGCKIKDCPPGHIYLDSNLSECVPRSICKPSCMIIEDKIYYEGDLIEKDKCHSCTCLRGEKHCQGKPCPAR